jgi:hypothetical protein
MSDYDPGDHGYSLEDVCDRLDKIEEAVKANRRELSWVGLVIFGWLVLAGFSDMWNSKARYSLWYSVGYDQVTVQKKPTDCNFFHAPIGDKDCHYDRQVSTIRVKTENSDPARFAINYVSYDDGNTWIVDDANPPTQPQVIVSWEKADDE